MPRPNINATSHFLDLDLLRQVLKEEQAIRGSSQTRIAEETGLVLTGVNRFLSGAQSMSPDALISLIKWTGAPTDRFIKRRGRGVRHVDSYEQRQLRNAAAYLKSLDIEVEAGESPVDALMRVVAESRRTDRVGDDA